MNIVTTSHARKNFKSVMQSVLKDREPLIITRPEGNVVVFPEDEWNSIQEAFHLLSSPENAKRLQRSLENIKNNQNSTTFNSLSELDDAI